jgi:hypothetical protein
MLCCAGGWPATTLVRVKAGALTQLTLFGATSQERQRLRRRRVLLQRRQ